MYQYFLERCDFAAVEGLKGIACYKTIIFIPERFF